MYTHKHYAHILTNFCNPQTSRSSQQAQELVSLAINYHAELIIPSVCMAATQSVLLNY